jgi:hypothetical protein
MRRIVLALASLVAVSPAALPAQTTKAPKVKKHKAAKHNAPKVKKRKAVKHGTN